MRAKNAQALKENFPAALRAAVVLGVIVLVSGSCSRQDPGTPALVRFYFEQQKKAEAVQEGKKMLRGCKNPELLTRTGSIFAYYHFTNMAGALFSKSLEVNPSYAETYVEFGKLYGNHDEFNRAISMWTEGLKIDPQDQRFRELISQARELSKSQPQAQEPLNSGSENPTP